MSLLHMKLLLTMSKCILEEVELERCLATIPMQLMVSYFSLHNTAWKIRSCKESLRKLEEQPEWLRGGKLCGKLFGEMIQMSF
nr:uncharacterized protein LOC112784595 isoform X2 [Arachis hypogaea]